ncbi:alcohol dehydrogenase (NADP(+)) [Malassezia cuniculi]|uniref:Alcohol dehydrogenase (NADP(+)) n=1 Tax=Malassezia cuniculi TaxID=948313 RepID=A0AAF0J8C8_9BASI|nr:alcohol dehydrogenase (NADP(+)) [Malassezia cuniculi]
MATITLPKIDLGTVFTGSSSGRVVKAKGQTIELQPDEVAIDIAYSGICGSDLHFLDKEIVLGHEGVGIISEIGCMVRNVKVGDRVGWGCNHASCNYCDACLQGNDHQCPERRLHGLSDSHFGSLGDKAIINSYFVHVIPDNIKLADAGPLQCGGATVYGALYNAAIRSSDRVGIIGIGGLGHLAIQYAAKMGCEVVVFSSTDSKKQQALELGATEFVATKENPGFENVKQIDALVVTTSAQPDWKQYISVMKPRGKIIPLSFSGEDFKAPYLLLLMNEIKIVNSIVANRYVHREMLRFSATHGIRPMIEVLPMNEESINEAMDRLKKGDVRYRFVLKSERTDAE